MMSALGRARPRVHATAFVHDSAQVIGNVSIGPQASIWPCAVLRGDVDGIVVGARTNIQDMCAVHCRHKRPTLFGRGVTVGHGAVLHGARIGDGCLIGMGAIVLESDIGAGCLVAAGSLVLAGMRIPPRSLVMGSPARVARRLSARELRSLKESADSYVRLMERYRRA